MREVAVASFDEKSECVGSTLHCVSVFLLLAFVLWLPTDDHVAPARFVWLRATEIHTH